MLSFLVERKLCDPAIADVFQLASAAHRAAARLQGDGARIHYLGSTFLAEDGRCLCLFESESLSLTDQLNRVEGLSFERISRAFSIQSPSLINGTYPLDHQSSLRAATSNTFRSFPVIP